MINALQSLSDASFGCTTTGSFHVIQIFPCLQSMYKCLCLQVALVADDGQNTLGALGFLPLVSATALIIQRHMWLRSIELPTATCSSSTHFATLLLRFRQRYASLLVRSKMLVVCVDVWLYAYMCISKNTGVS